MSPPARPPLLLPLPLLLALLLPTGAGGVDLRDAGYGDGSLVDSSGNYYYPQPNGGYLDTYGAAFNPLGDGLYSDALGNTIKVDPALAGPAGPNRATAEDTPAPGLRRGTVDRDPSRAPAGADQPNARSDATPDAGPSDFGPRYLEDVGDGYLNLTPDEPPPQSPPESPQDRARPAIGPAPGTSGMGRDRGY